MYSGASVEEQHMTRNKEGASMMAVQKFCIHDARSRNFLIYTSDTPEYQTLKITVPNLF